MLVPVNFTKGGDEAAEFERILEWTKKVEQEWQGTFYLPSNVFCIAVDTMQAYCSNCNQVKYVSGGKTCCSVCQTVLEKQEVFDYHEYTKIQTVDGKEEFLKQTGYLVVSFDIRIKSKLGNWYIFDIWEDTKLAKDALAMNWNYGSASL